MVAARDDDEMSWISADTESTGADKPIVVELRKKPKNAEKKTKFQITDTAKCGEDEQMKQLMAKWDEENGKVDYGNDDDDDDDDDGSEVRERDVFLDDNVIDHIVLAASDLDQAMREFEKKTGLAAIIAGSVKGLGIICARVSFTGAAYLEIIAPDPKTAGPIGQLIRAKGITELTPFHFAIRTKRAEQLKDEVGRFGYTPDHVTMVGAKPDGTPRKWEMLYLYGHNMGGTCPFFVNWTNSDHPCALLPVVGNLEKLTIRVPDDDPVHALVHHVGARGITCESGDKPTLEVKFSSPKGIVKFSTNTAIGFKFPGF